MSDSFGEATAMFLGAEPAHYTAFRSDSFDLWVEDPRGRKKRFRPSHGEFIGLSGPVYMNLSQSQHPAWKSMH